MAHLIKYSDFGVSFVRIKQAMIEQHTVRARGLSWSVGIEVLHNHTTDHDGQGHEGMEVFYRSILMSGGQPQL